MTGIKPITRRSHIRHCGFSRSRTLLRLFYIGNGHRINLSTLLRVERRHFSWPAAKNHTIPKHRFNTKQTKPSANSHLSHFHYFHRRALPYKGINPQRISLPVKSATALLFNVTVMKKFFPLFSKKNHKHLIGIFLNSGYVRQAKACFCRDISSQANGFITFFHSGTHYGKHNFLSSCCHPVDCFSLFSDFLYQRSEKDQADF